ncbi:MAG: hypothetical protein LBT56_06260 [Prevotellaceae bacterium]|jgi:hypothetical protein|nr:hypothetical protein [Prevotellaceae bacterium]
MKKIILYLILFIFVLPLFSCGQTNNDSSINGLIIDASIKNEVEKNISSLNFGEVQDKLLIYNNRMFVDYYEDNELMTSTTDKEIKQVFKSFYYWQGDTLGIDGAFGFFGGVGFSIKITENKATLYHLLASDEFPTYAYNENDNLLFRIEVPCTDTKIILSKIPDSTKNQVIYGYVEFKSEEYYSSSGSVEEHEISPRKKQRVDMKIYFKSTKLNI